MLHGPNMVAVIVAITFVGVLPLVAAGVCALFIAVGAAVPTSEAPTRSFTPAPYQPMAILTRSAHAV